MDASYFDDGLAAVDTMIECACKVFRDEWGDPPYYLQDQIDFFRICLDVVSEIVSYVFSPLCVGYFDTQSELKFKEYFPDKKWR